MFRRNRPIALRCRRYFDVPAYLVGLLRNIVRQNEIHVPPKGARHEVKFRVSRNLEARWNQLFHRAPHAPNPLQTMYQQISANYLFSVLDRMRISFANVMHLAIDIEMHSEFSGFDTKLYYRCETQLREVKVLPIGKLALVFRTEIYSQIGQILITHDDTMLVLNSSDSDRKKISDHLGVVETHEARFCGLSNRIAAIDPRSDAEVRHVFLSNRVGYQYGCLSGDFNPVHISGWVSRLFGHKGAFAQGLLTTNLMLQNLMTHQKLPLRRLNIVFTRPAYLNQELRFVNHRDQCEIHSHDGELLAMAEFAVWSMSSMSTSA